MNLILKKTFLLIVILSSALMYSGCGNKTKFKNFPQQSFNVKIGFDEVYNKVFEGNCVECHSSYATYKLAAAQSKKMLEAVLSGRMPKARPALNREQIDILQTWVSLGAPEFAGGSGIQSVKLEPNFESLLVNFFAPKCLSCHSGNSNAPGPVNINFSTYESFLKSVDDYNLRNQAQGYQLISDEPETSDLIFILTDTDEGGQPMPPATLPGDLNYINPGFATEEEILVLSEWILKGTPQL